MILNDLGSGLIKGIQQFIIKSATNYAIEICNPSPASDGAPGGKALIVYFSDNETPALKIYDYSVYSLGGITGEIKMGYWSSAPLGWLFCHGQAVSRSTYSDLFAATGTIYGIGDGSTTFNVPNYDGRVPIGADGVTYILGSNYGAATVDIRHNHPIPDHHHTFSHTHTMAHDHTYSHTHGTAHTHDTDLGHDHANSNTGDDSASQSVQEGTSGSFKTTSAHVHQHPFDTVAIASPTNVTTNGQNTTVTVSQNTSTTGSASLSTTSAPTPTDTDDKTGLTTSSALSQTQSVVQPSLATAYIIKY